MIEQIIKLVEEEIALVLDSPGTKDGYILGLRAAIMIIRKRGIQ